MRFIIASLISIFFSSLMLSLSLNAQTDLTSKENHSTHSSHTLWPTSFECSSMLVWDMTTGMCMPLPMKDMPMRMAMVHGNMFGVRTFQEGPRGRDAWASPNMLMGDIGTSLGDYHYLNLDLMLTAEKWTFPKRGYPLLLQIGEENENGTPYIDAQHPHSSPIMGLTLSDTIAWKAELNHLKIFFSPRGSTTDGPIAFMHRPTGMINPDAPLGHHIAQDVSHITSTVIGASLKLGSHRFEASVYNGEEPSPEEVDLPLGKPDSFSFRFIEEFSKYFVVMASFARVDSPEHDVETTEYRYSASAYWQSPLSAHWSFYNTLIYGLITDHDSVEYLHSFAEEFLFRGSYPRIWARLELLQRSPDELTVLAASNQFDARWVTAATLGYSHKLFNWQNLEMNLGGSVTKDFIPSSFEAAYGDDPWSGRVFLQLTGMKMMEF